MDQSEITRLNLYRDLTNVGDDMNAHLVQHVENGKTYVKKERGADGLTDKERERNFKQRKVERPDAETLKNLLYSYNFKKVGKMFGVSDKTICKWCKVYKMPTHAKDYKL